MILLSHSLYGTESNSSCRLASSQIIKDVNKENYRYSFEGIKGTYLSYHFLSSSRVELDYIVRSQSLRGKEITSLLVQKFADDNPQVQNVQAYYISSNFKVIYLKLAELLQVQLEPDLKKHLKTNGKYKLTYLEEDPVREAFYELGELVREQILLQAIKQAPLSKYLMNSGFKRLESVSFNIEEMDPSVDSGGLFDSYYIKVNFSRNKSRPTVVMID